MLIRTANYNWSVSQERLFTSAKGRMGVIYSDRLMWWWFCHSYWNIHGYGGTAVMSLIGNRSARVVSLCFDLKVSNKSQWTFLSITPVVCPYVLRSWARSLWAPVRTSRRCRAVASAARWATWRACYGRRIATPRARRTNATPSWCRSATCTAEEPTARTPSSWILSHSVREALVYTADV